MLRSSINIELLTPHDLRVHGTKSAAVPLFIELFEFIGFIGFVTHNFKKDLHILFLKHGLKSSRRLTLFSEEINRLSDGFPGFFYTIPETGDVKLQ